MLASKSSYCSMHDWWCFSHSKIFLFFWWSILQVTYVIVSEVFIESNANFYRKFWQSIPYFLMQTIHKYDINICNPYMYRYTNIFHIHLKPYPWPYEKCTNIIVTSAYVGIKANGLQWDNWNSRTLTCVSQLKSRTALVAKAVIHWIGVQLYVASGTR